MSAEEHKAVIAKIDNLKTQIASLETLVQPLYKQPIDQMTAQLTPLDAARLHSVIAYALATLEVAYLRLDGVNIKTHQIAADLQQIKQSMDKMKATTTMLAEEVQKKEEKTDTTTMNDNNTSSTTSTDTKKDSDDKKKVVEDTHINSGTKPRKRKA